MEGVGSRKDGKYSSRKAFLGSLSWQPIERQWLAAMAGNSADDEELALRIGVRRASLQAWRLELHAHALTTAAAARWAVVPPPHAQSLEARQSCVRRQLRILAVMCTCFAPFAAWARLCMLRRAERLASLRAEAAAAMRLVRLRGNMISETVSHLRKQDATLRALALRSATAAAIRQWATASEALAQSRKSLLHLRLRHLQRWRVVSCVHRRYGPMTIVRARRRQYAAALRALSAAATLRRWLGSMHDRARLVRGVSGWAGWRRAQRGMACRVASGWRRVRLSALGRGLCAWCASLASERRHARKHHQDASLTSLLGLWALTASMPASPRTQPSPCLICAVAS